MSVATTAIEIRFPARGARLLETAESGLSHPRFSPVLGRSWTDVGLKSLAVLAGLQHTFKIDPPARSAISVRGSAHLRRESARPIRELTNILPARRRTEGRQVIEGESACGRKPAAKRSREVGTRCVRPSDRGRAARWGNSRGPTERRRERLRPQARGGAQSRGRNAPRSTERPRARSEVGKLKGPHRAKLSNGGAARI